jgi:methionyl-tRNA formyltransferase
VRIALVTRDDPFYLPPALDALCRARGREIVGIVILPVFNERQTATVRRLYEFYGPLDFARLALRHLGAKLADRANRLRPFTRAYSAADVARRHGIPVYRPAKVNAPEFVTLLREQIQPDLLVSIAASQVLRQRVLDVPALGCINLHSAPLPRYQGMMPTFWTMVHGEPEATVTVHYMVEKLDTGDIVLQWPVPILPTDSLHDLMMRSREVGAQAILEAVEQIEHGTVRRQPMDPSRATYFAFPRREDARQLRRMGRALL